MAGARTQPSLSARIEGAGTLWELACALLLHWRAERPAAPARHADDEAYDRWADLEYAAQEHFRGRRAPDELDASDAAFVLEATDAGADADAVDAIAWGMSKVTSHTFAPAWHQQLGGGSHELAAGAFYPVADAPWDGHGKPLAARAASLSPARVDELPTIRAHDGSFRATVDFTFSRTLEAVAATLDEIVTCHPNERWDELAFPHDGQRVFPVAPADPARQRETIFELLDAALEHRPQAVLLPELSVTEPLVEALHARVRELDEPCLLVAGSFHRARPGDGAGENVAVGLVSGAPERMEHRKNIPFTDDVRRGKATKEGIAALDPLHVTVHQADRFRFAVVICKELLTEQVGACLDRMGANVLLVPALSLKPSAFRNAASARVAGAQALTVVANGPLRGPDDAPLQPAIVVGQPSGHSPIGFAIGAAAPVIARIRTPS